MSLNRKLKTKMKFIKCLLLILIIVSCQTKKENKKAILNSNTNTKEFQNKAHELVYNMVQKAGTYQDLINKKDVVYTYTYTTPDGKTDISTEKYVFNGELSYGEYIKHERTFPQIKAVIEQGYDGENYWLKSKDSVFTDEKLLKIVAFKRPTNFYWFTMFQKLLDPGLNYEYKGERSIDTKKYDVINVSFSSDEPTDIYQIFINKETGLVDQFLFTVADFGIVDEPRIMQVEYEKIDGMLIPSKRKYKKSDWNATISDKPWITVNWTNIKFDNGLTKDDFVL